MFCLVLCILYNGLDLDGDTDFVLSYHILFLKNVASVFHTLTCHSCGIIEFSYHHTSVSVKKRNKYTYRTTTGIKENRNFLQHKFNVYILRRAIKKKISGLL